MLQLLTFTSIALFVVALFPLALLGNYHAPIRESKAEGVTTRDKRSARDIFVRKRYCPRCKKRTVQITEIALDDDPGFGQIWKCAECSARLEFIPPLNP